MPGGEAPRTYPKRTQITSLGTPNIRHLRSRAVTAKSLSNDPDTVKHRVRPARIYCTTATVGVPAAAATA
jgi:hypothetical protein